ncbi:MAG: ZIP family metal transporter [Alphaproteobacteria bacterium]|nr:ZIP family metal transporter [Alphaproteobacteria bacterium]
MDPTVLNVAIAGLVTALATGLGALPLLLRRRIGGRALGVANGIAAGLMLAASFSLMVEGNEIGVSRTVLGMILGLGAIALGQRLLKDREEFHVGNLRGADARRALLIVGVMTLHSFAEGIGVGVAFGGEGQLGPFITLAIAIHNIPEGLAIALVMVPRGSSITAAGGWSIVSSLPQPLLAVPAFLFVMLFQPVLPVGLGLAAGAMIWMVLAELLPEANEAAGPQLTALTTTLALALMMAFQRLALPDV